MSARPSVGVQETDPDGPRVPSSPYARRIARQTGVDLAGLGRGAPVVAGDLARTRPRADTFEWHQLSFDVTDWSDNPWHRAARFGVAAARIVTMDGESATLSLHMAGRGADGRRAVLIDESSQRIDDLQAVLLDGARSDDDVSSDVYLLTESCGPAWLRPRGSSLVVSATRPADQVVTRGGLIAIRSCVEVLVGVETSPDRQQGIETAEAFGRCVRLPDEGGCDE